jgi:hypothetical protein
MRASSGLLRPTKNGELNYPRVREALKATHWHPGWECPVGKLKYWVGATRPPEHRAGADSMSGVRAASFFSHAAPPMLVAPPPRGRTLGPLDAWRIKSTRRRLGPKKSGSPRTTKPVASACFISANARSKSSELRTPVGTSLTPGLSAASSVAFNQSAAFLTRTGRFTPRTPASRRAARRRRRRG